MREMPPVGWFATGFAYTGPIRLVGAVKPYLSFALLRKTCAGYEIVRLEGADEASNAFTTLGTYSASEGDVTKSVDLSAYNDRSIRVRFFVQLCTGGNN